MTIHVFLGPTLSVDDARAELDAIYLPPVSQGDVYRVAQRQPSLIAIIDGYFERVPAVWHKEILWALSRGIPVIGASSMGALRAAELHTFGMEGVGAVFRAYRDGVIDADDEVAVAHAAAEFRFRPLSEALVNIRATLTAAAAASTITAATEAALVDAARSLFYPDRCYPRLLELGAARGLPADELAALRGWLPGNHINQKRLDALELLRTIRARADAGIPAAACDFHFEHTGYWDRLTRTAGQLDGGSAGADDATSHDAVLDELRLDGSYAQAHKGALLRLLGTAEAERRGLAPDGDALDAWTAHFRTARGLVDDDALLAWRVANQVSAADLARLMREQAMLVNLSHELASALTRVLPDQLRMTGQYDRLRERAADKRRSLAARGLDDATARDLGLTEEQLVQWYFARRRQPVPDSLDGYLGFAGFADRPGFLAAIAREYAYSQVANGEPATSASSAA